MFSAETDLTHASLYAYFLTFVDENGVVSGSTLGIQRSDTEMSGTVLVNAVLNEPLCRYRCIFSIFPDNTNILAQH